MRNRNIETAKLACFLNSLRPSFIRVVRRKNIERAKRKIEIAAVRKAMILKIIVHSQCSATRSLDNLVGAAEQRDGEAECLPAGHAPLLHNKAPDLEHGFQAPALRGES